MRSIWKDDGSECEEAAIPGVGEGEEDAMLGKFTLILLEYLLDRCRAGFLQAHMEDQTHRSRVVLNSFAYRSAVKRCAT